MRRSNKNNLGMVTFLTMGISSFYLMDNSLFLGSQEQKIDSEKKDPETQKVKKPQSLVDKITSNFNNRKITFDQWFQTSEATKAFETWKKSPEALKVLTDEFKKDEKFDEYLNRWAKNQKDSIKNWKKWMLKKDKTTQYFDSWKNLPEGQKPLGSHYLQKAKQENLPIFSEMNNWVSSGPKKRTKDFWIDTKDAKDLHKKWILKPEKKFLLQNAWKRSDTFAQEQNKWVTKNNQKPTMAKWEELHGKKSYKKWLFKQVNNQDLFNNWKITQNYETKVESFLKKGKHQTKRTFDQWKNDQHFWFKNFKSYKTSDAFKTDSTNFFIKSEEYQEKFDNWKKVNKMSYENWLNNDYSNSFYNKWIKESQNLKKVSDDENYGFKKTISGANNFLDAKTNWINAQNHKVKNWIESGEGKNQFQKWVNTKKLSILNYWYKNTNHYQDSLKTWVESSGKTLVSISKKQWLNTLDGQNHFQSWIKKPSLKNQLTYLWKSDGKNDYEAKVAAWIGEGPKKQSFDNWKNNEAFWNKGYENWKTTNHYSFLKNKWESNLDNDYLSKKNDWLNAKGKRSKTQWLASSFVDTYYNNWKTNSHIKIKNEWKKTKQGDFNFQDSQEKWINNKTKNKTNLNYWFQNSNYQDDQIRNDHSFNEEFKKWINQEGDNLLKSDFDHNQLAGFKNKWLQKQNIPTLTKEQWSSQNVSNQAFFDWTKDQEFNNSRNLRFNLWKKDSSDSGYNQKLQDYIISKSGINDFDFSIWKTKNFNLLKAKWESKPIFQTQMNSWVSKQENIDYSNAKFLKWSQENEEELKTLWRSSPQYAKAYEDYKTANSFLTKEQWKSSIFLNQYFDNWRQESDNSYILENVYKKSLFENKYKNVEFINSYKKAFANFKSTLTKNDWLDNIKSFSNYDKYYQDWEKTSLKYLKYEYQNSNTYQSDLTNWQDKFNLPTSFEQKRKHSELRKEIAKLIGGDGDVLLSNNAQYKKEFYAWLMPQIISIKDGSSVNQNDFKKTFSSTQNWGKSFLSELYKNFEQTINNPYEYFNWQNMQTKIGWGYNTRYLSYNSYIPEYKNGALAYYRIKKPDWSWLEETFYRFGEQEDKRFIQPKEFVKNFLSYVKYVINPFLRTYSYHSNLMSESYNLWKNKIKSTFWKKVYTLWKNREYDPLKILDHLDVKATNKNAIINQKINYYNHIDANFISQKKLWGYKYPTGDGLFFPEGYSPYAFDDLRGINQEFSFRENKYSWKELIEAHQDEDKMLEVLSMMDLKKFRYYIEHRDRYIINRMRIMRLRGEDDQAWLDSVIEGMFDSFKEKLKEISSTNDHLIYTEESEVDSDYATISLLSKTKIKDNQILMINYSAIDEFEKSKAFQNYKNNNPTAFNLRKVKLNYDQFYNLYEHDDLNKLFVKYFENKWLAQVRRSNDAGRSENKIAAIDDFKLSLNQINQLNNQYNNLSNKKKAEYSYYFSNDFSSNFKKWLDLQNKENYFKNSYYANEEFFKNEQWKKELFNLKKLSKDKTNTGYFNNFSPYQNWFNKWFKANKPINSWIDTQTTIHNNYLKDLYKNDDVSIIKDYDHWKVAKKITKSDFEKDSSHDIAFNQWKNDKNLAFKQWLNLDVGQKEKDKQNKEKYLAKQSNWIGDFNSWTDDANGGIKYFEEEILEKTKWTNEYNNLRKWSDLDTWSKIKANILPDFFENSAFFKARFKKHNDNILKQYDQKYLDEQYSDDYNNYWDKVINQELKMQRKHKKFIDQILNDQSKNNIYLNWYKNYYLKEVYKNDLNKWINANNDLVFNLYKNDDQSDQDYNQWNDPEKHQASDFKKGLKAYEDALSAWILANGKKWYLLSDEAKVDYNNWIDPRVRTKVDYNKKSNSERFLKDLYKWTNSDNLGDLFLQDKEAIEKYNAYNVKLQKDNELKFQASADKDSYFNNWINLKVESVDLFKKDKENINVFNIWQKNEYLKSNQFNLDLKKWATKTNALEIYKKYALSDYQKWEQPNLTNKNFQKEKVYETAYNNFVLKNNVKIYHNSKQALNDYENWKDPLIRTRRDYELNSDFYQDDFVEYYLKEDLGFKKGYDSYSKSAKKNDYDNFKNEKVFTNADFLNSKEYQQHWKNWINNYDNTKAFFKDEDEADKAYQNWIDPDVRTQEKFKQTLKFKTSLNTFVAANQNILIKDIFIHSSFVENIYKNWGSKKWQEYWEEVGLNPNIGDYLASNQAYSDIKSWVESSFEKTKRIFQNTPQAQSLFNRYKEVNS